ncbi:SDR family oxidoreductase [Planctomonas psychrotolerans]|uniref:SDR family oxidoreductase n=1 Tax=Planctomonas psychrotolerans TaxID=2528712 RepID=UPI001238B2C1|nr:SDR family oxidoreductase [Planctomonas psychrotolerans]
MTLFAITGSTGSVGGMVARSLAERGARMRLLVRRPDSAPALPDAEVVELVYGSATAEALEGVDALFMVSGSESATRREEHRTLVSAAAEAGVPYIVYTSFAGAGSDSAFTLARDHADTEAAIRESGMAFTFLRDNFYLDVLPLFADEEGVIRGPAGDGRVAAVARADVADAAVAVLSDPEAHAGRAYTLTGGEALTFDEVAERTSAATGRSVRFHNETVEEAYESRRRFGAPDYQVDAWVSTYTAIAEGELAEVTGDVQHLTGSAPRRLEDVLAAPA